MNDNNQCTSAMNEEYFEENQEYSGNEIQQEDFDRFLNQEDPLSCLTKKNYLVRGGFGNVYRCSTSEIKNQFTMKEVLFNSNEVIEKEVTDLENEIKIYSRLKRHPRIIPFLGMIKKDDALYIFMEFMNEGSLAEYLAANGKLDLPKIARYTKQILEGLDFLHGRQIIHRDIKGANIVRDHQDNVKLCDFGISKHLGTISSGNPTPQIQEKGVTNTDCGTSYWMAPEVINGDNYSFSADIWSLGATVVEMLTGTHPYPNDLTYQALFKIGSTGRLEYESPKNVTPQCQRFLDSMLQRNPEDRAHILDLLNSEFIRFVSETEEMQE